MGKSPSKRTFDQQQEMKPSPSQHEISNTELLNITYSRLPDINLGKNQQNVEAKQMNQFNQMTASQEMISPKIGYPSAARNGQNLNTTREVTKMMNNSTNQSRINNQQSMVTSPQQQKLHEEIDGASMLSQNEWVEVINYQREIDEEKIQREKQVKEKLKQQNRISLEKQLEEKRQRQQNEKDQQRQLEMQLLQNIRDKELMDLTKKSESLNKVQQQKMLREQQLRDALNKRQSDFVSKQQNDLLTINKMHLEVEQERERQRLMKQQKREKEQKVINDNEMQQMGKIYARRVEKEEDVSAFNSFKHLVETDEQRRNQERIERQEKIKKVLNRQAVISVDQQSHHYHTNESELDKKIRENQDRLAFEEKLKQEKKREEQRRMQGEIKQRLDLQVQEKRVREQSEKLANEDYHRSIVQRVQMDEAFERQKEEQKSRQRLEFKSNLLLQMGHINNAQPGAESHKSPQSSIGGNLQNGRRRIQMESMTNEELRLNKQLLQEISQRKKERMERMSMGQDI
ncbi:hypothetical protein FGO68_gene7798 [Halteria grandinella]|uniref:Uncharacterized protein n=1 Tax=Halteria grandinella TaxID=5974 RepID=A0A8J8SX44_HALGN|nr:hypothetical protein FGO68_gene7798 [Halteria grandinella]